MTTPSSNPIALEAAKAALKQKLIDALVSEKVKTDKVVALLKTSPQYQDYLVQAAASHLEYFHANGGVTGDARKAAENSARVEADKLLAGPTIDDLKARAEGSLQMLRMTSDGLQTKIAGGEAAIAAIDAISEYEFVKDITSKKILVITFNRSAVKSTIAELKSRMKKVGELQTELQTAMRSGDDKTMRAAIRRVEDKITAALKSLNEAAKAYSAALDSTSATIDEKALEALITQKVAKKELAKLESAKKWFDRMISVSNSVLDKTSVTATVTSGAGLINTVGFAVAKDQVVDKRAGEYSAKNTRGQVYAEHDRDPLMLATNLVDRQKTALEVLMRTLDTALSGAMIATMGAGEAVMQVWKPISKGITIVVRSRLETRLQLARDAVAARNAALALQYGTDESKSLEGAIQKGIEDVVKDVVKDTVKGAASGEGGGGVLDKIKDEPGDFAAMIVSALLPPLMIEIWKIFPPKPAQEVSGADLTDMQNVLFAAQIPMQFGGAPAQRAPRAAATAITDQPNDVEAGVWAKFKATNAGRTQNKDDPATRLYRVAVEMPAFGNVTVWGDFNPRTNDFAPEQLEQSVLEDWSNRTIAGTGYSDGPLVNAQPAVRGTWEVVRVGQTNYIALTEGGGTMHWGNRGANTMGPQGTKSLLGNIVMPLSPRERAMERFTISG